MGKLKSHWVKTDIPKNIKIKLWRIMRDNPTYDSFQKHIANFPNLFVEDEDKYIRMSRETYTRLKEEIKLMPIEDVHLLPSDLQDWITQIRPEFKGKLEYDGKQKIREGVRELVPRELIPKIEKLAKRLQWLIRVPEPERPLLTEEMMKGKEIIKGNAVPYLKVVRTLNTPWWCTEPSIHVYLDLNAEQQALFNRLLSLPESRRFKMVYDEWERRTNRYLDLVRSGLDKDQVKVVYQEATQAECEAHSELWKAVQAIYWSD